MATTKTKTTKSASQDSPTTAKVDAAPPKAAAKAKKEAVKTATSVDNLTSYAILNLGGKQQLVRPGDQIHVEKLVGEVGAKLQLDQVLLRKDNGQVQVGQPYVVGAAVKATILGESKGEKLIVFHKKRRKHYRKKVGHRQHYTVLEIQSI